MPQIHLSRNLRGTSHVRISLFISDLHVINITNSRFTGPLLVQIQSYVLGRKRRM